MNQTASRHPATPSAMPRRRWTDVFIGVYRNIETNRVIIVAAGVSFYSPLAIFPAIAGLFADPAAISSHLDSASGLLPGGAIEVIRDRLTRTSSRGSGTLGFTFLGGLAFSLWSANAGMKSIFDALNLLYNEEEKRGFVLLNLVSLMFTAAAIVFALTAIALVIALPIVLDFIGLGVATDLTFRVGRWPLLFLAFALAVLYRYGASCSKPKLRWIWGSAFGAIAWIITSVLFSWYTANFGSYDKTYGSLGAVIGFMVWLWISMIVILVGAAINAEMERQAAISMRGRPKPLGVTASEANRP